MRFLVLTLGTDAVTAAVPSEHARDDFIHVLNRFDAAAVGQAVLSHLARAAADTEPARGARDDLSVTMYLRATDVELD